MQKFKRRPLSVQAMQHTDALPRVYYTTQGVMAAECGDWIVHEPSGLVFVMKPDQFRATFEPET